MEMIYNTKEMRQMDTFDVLHDICKRKNAFMHCGIKENEALLKAQNDVSKEYHIPLFDIQKMVRA